MPEEARKKPTLNWKEIEGGTVDEAYRRLWIVDDNLRYVLNELPTLDVPEEFLDDAREACAGFRLAVGQCRLDLDAFADGGRPGPLPRALAAGIMERLSAALREVDALVRSLEERRAARPELGILFVLVAESAANMIHATDGLGRTLALLASPDVEVA